jgi:hypothetical protein
VNRSTGCSVTLIRCVFARSRSSLPPSVSTQMHPALHVSGVGNRDLQLQLHRPGPARPGPELNRLPQARRLHRAQVTAHCRDRVRQARELTISVTHAKHPLHLASSRHTRRNASNCRNGRRSSASRIRLALDPPRRTRGGPADPTYGPRPTMARRPSMPGDRGRPGTAAG